MNRRKALFSITGAAAAVATVARAETSDILTTRPHDVGLSAHGMPSPVRRGGQAFLTDAEKRTVSALFDRIIPADSLGPSASEAGCVDFVDMQLAGPFGRADAFYRDGPFEKGDPLVQPQLRETPAERYRMGVVALDAYCQQAHGAPYADLSPDQQDAVLAGMEDGSVVLEGMHTKAFFSLLLQNAREGYFSDPIYGGNKDMAGWKMVGFPGARYDFRPYIDRRGEKLDIAPVGLIAPRG